MKILYYMRQTDSLMDAWQSVHIFDELARHEIAVEIFNPLRFDCLDAANEAVIKTARNGRYDLFMTAHNEKELYVDTLLQIKALGLPTLLICFDNLIIPYVHHNVARYFDLVWLTEPGNQELFTRWGAKWIHLPYAANPYFFRYHPQSEVLRTVFVGTPYGSRANMINALLKADVPVTLYTEEGGTTGGKSVAISRVERLKQNARSFGEFLMFPAGRKVLLSKLLQTVRPEAELLTRSDVLEKKPQIPFEVMPELYASYALSLSDTTLRNTGVLKHPAGTMHLRCFEISMCGGIQLCRYQSDLAECFEPDREILFYHSDEELTEKARFYLAPKRRQLRADIRIAARKRAESEHTWYCRFSGVFEAMGI